MWLRTTCALVLGLAPAGARAECSVAGKAKALAATLKTVPAAPGFTQSDVDRSAPILRGLKFEPECADQALRWLGSDDLTERRAGAAYVYFSLEPHYIFLGLLRQDRRPEGYKVTRDDLQR